MDQTDTTDSKAIKRFKDIESIRIARELHGTIHDCKESGCIVDLNGNQISQGKEPTRPDIDSKISTLSKTLGM